MSNAEHLIENALVYYEMYKNFDYFRSAEYNIRMAEEIGISLKDIEAMAIHILYAFKPDWEQAAEDRLVEQYGYDIRSI